MEKHGIATIRVWDLPTRLFHWALVACVLGSFITVKLGGLWMTWHVRFGLTILGLIVFRIIWGFCGPRYARFAQFVRGPRYVLDYLRGRRLHYAGHNPLGALSVLALLASFGFQAFSGLFANDDVMTTGPLAYLSDSLSDTMTGLHDINQWVMVALVCVHVGAIIWYRRVRGIRLVGPMLSGDAPIAAYALAEHPAADDSWRYRLGALLLCAAIAALIWWLQGLAPVADFS